MVSTEQRNEIIRLGALAEDVMANEAFQTAMNQAMNDVFGQFLATQPVEDEERTKMWAVGQAMDGLRNRLNAMVESATVEKRNKAEDESQ